MRLWRTTTLVATAIVLQACASRLPAPPPVAGTSAPVIAPLAPDCRAWLERLDQRVLSEGVADAQDHRIPGAVYARVNRLLGSWRTALADDDPRFADWASMLADRGEEGLLLEWSRLPLVARQDLMSAPAQRVASTDGGPEHIRLCVRQLLNADLKDVDARRRLLANAVAPDAYVQWQRWVGIYPITRMPFAAGVRRWQAQTQVVFDEAKAASNPLGERAGEAVRSGKGIIQGAVRYQPQPRAMDTPGETTQPPRGLPLHRNTLGFPMLASGERAGLLAAHAPVLLIAGQTDDDRPGAVRVSRSGQVEVDVDRPTAYVRVSHTRWGDQVLVQLNYLFWFASRPSESPFDLLAGRFDGFIWRVTLDEQGKPLVYDTIHACGCYHEFFPTPAVHERPVPAAEEGNEWVFSPAMAPVLEPGDRVLLHLDAGSHYLSALSIVSSNPRSITPAGSAVHDLDYQMVSENNLRALPTPAAGSSPAISLYGPDGLVPGSERLERFLFWPMGIPSAGAQRQWGHHATAFVGKRHFDDPFLFEQRFERLPVTSGSKKAMPVAGHGL